MSPKPLKARRVAGTNKGLVIGLVAVVSLLVAVIAYLLLTGPIFDEAPKTDAERDLLMLQQALERNPDSAEVLMAIAEAEYRLGREEDALAHGKNASEVASDTAQVNLRYAQLLVQSDMLPEAEKALRKELEITEDKSGEAYYLLGQVLFNGGDEKAGLTAIEGALKRDPMAADIRITYAAMLADSGRKEDAIKQYKTALKFLPDDERAIAGLRGLGVKYEPDTSTPSPHE